MVEKSSIGTVQLQKRPDPEEVGRDTAVMLASFNVELVAKGIDPQLAERLTEKVAGTASSFWNGHCGELLNKYSAVSR